MVASGPTRQQAIAEEVVQAESVQMQQPMVEQEPQALTSNAELIELLEAELEADFCCPLTLVCSRVSKLYMHNNVSHADTMNSIAWNNQQTQLQIACCHVLLAKHCSVCWLCTKCNTGRAFTPLSSYAAGGV